MLHTAYQCCIYPRHTLYKLQFRFVSQILDCMRMLQWSCYLQMSPSVLGSCCNLIRHHCLLLPSTCQQHTQDTCHSTLQKCWQNACPPCTLCRQHFLVQSYTCPRYTRRMVLLHQGPRTLGYTCTPPKTSFLTMRSSWQDNPGTCSWKSRPGQPNTCLKDTANNQQQTLIRILLPQFVCSSLLWRPHTFQRCRVCRPHSLCGPCTFPRCK